MGLTLGYTLMNALTTKQIIAPAQVLPASLPELIPNPNKIGIRISATGT